MSFAAASITRYYLRPGMAFVPVPDVSGSVVALGWRDERVRPTVRRFVEVAREVRDRERAVVRAIRDGAAVPAAKVVR